jgi:mono/diheme cytochrome c family protein
MMVGVKSSTKQEINAVGRYIAGLSTAAVAAATPTPLDGEAIFKTNCATCHGDDGKGRVGPDITHASLEDIWGAIDRVPMMLAMKTLGAKDVGATANYLAELRKSKPQRVSE